VKVKEFELTNFRGIESMALTFTDSTTAIVGVNGVGKSSVLDALAIALSGLIFRVLDQSNKSRDISVDDIRLGSDFSRISVRVEIENREVDWAFAKNRKSGKHQGIRTSLLESLNRYTEPVADILRKAMSSELAVSLPLAVYYDVHRAVLDVPLRVKGVLKNTPHEAYSDALSHGGTDFRGFFAWFRQREDAENERIRDESNFRDRDLEAVRNAIELFTRFTKLRIRRKPTLRMTVQKEGHELNVMQLSDGEKCMLALVGDLARRLSLLNTALDNPLEGNGVVLIDEVDLHLHPRWQRSVLSDLARTFPNCQFIVTTHSPQIIGELKPEAVLLLRDGMFCGHPERSLGLDSGEVLDEIMEGTARNASVTEDLRKIRRALDDDELDQAQRMLEQLMQRVGRIPDVLEARAALDMLRWLPEDEE